MQGYIRAFVYLIQFLGQRAAFILFAAAAGFLIATCLMASFGALPWLQLDLQWNAQPVEKGGMYLQIGLAVLFAGLCFFLPSNRRVMALENSHRNFSIGMEDVARAYAAVHAADRSGTFQLSSEFDAVRERLAYLRDHPDLDGLEPHLLEIAAQMSHVSRELAEVYSDDKVNRARDFLRQRQQEIDSFNARIDQAKAVSQELRHWLHEVELEESVASAQLQRLRDELRNVLPELGLETVVKADNTVVELPPKAAE